MTPITLVAARDEERLDEFLCRECPAELPSRSQAKRAIEAQRISVNGVVAEKAGLRLRAGDTVSVNPPPLSMQPRDTERTYPPVPVLFEDDHLIVIAKPPGITVHSGAGCREEESLLGALRVYWGGRSELAPTDPIRPGVVHRLDKDTSGSMVLAKDVVSHASLAEQFSSRSVDRAYTALIRTTPRGGALGEELAGEIEGNIGRSPRDRKRMTVLATGGRYARTTWRLVERFAYATLIEARLTTGRTHQIRVHFAHRGAPVVGDRQYGSDHLLPEHLAEAARRFGRQALHAHLLSFTHPHTGERLSFSVPVPPDFVTLIDLFRRAV